MMTRWLALAVFAFAPMAQAYFNYWDEPDPETYLTNIGAPPPCDYTITNNAGWDQINNTAHRVFCVAPGDYSTAGAEGGRITLRADGTAAAPRWIRYENPAVGSNVHPYHMTTAQRARVSRFTLDSADYWIIDRIFIDPTDSNRAVSAVNSNHNVLSRLYMTGFSRGIEFKSSADYNTVQYTVASNSTRGSDGVAFQVNGEGVADSKFNRFISNECFNVNDCFQLLGEWNPPPAAEEDYEGTIVYNNDFYLTNAVYTNCEGTNTTAGLCATTENPFDVKSGTESTTNPIIIAHNRAWGWRKADPTIGAISSWGNHITIHNNVKNVRFEGNILWDGPRIVGGGNPVTNFVIANNLLHSVNPDTIGTTKTNAFQFTLANSGGLTFTGNVIAEAQGAKVESVKISGDYNMTFTNNVLINASGSTVTDAGGTISGNKYYNSDVAAWDTAPAVNVGSVVGTAYDTEFCTTIKRITNPTTMCFDNAVLDENVEPPVGGAPSKPSNFMIID